MVETQTPAGLQHRCQRAQVHRMLRLVVGGAAAVNPIAVALQGPGIAVVLPAPLLPAHHVAVAVAEQGGHASSLVAPRQQHGSLALERVVINPAPVAERLEGRLHHLL